MSGGLGALQNLVYILGRIRTRIVELGGTVLGGSPAEFRAIIADAVEKWAKVIKFAGIKIE